MGPDRIQKLRTWAMAGISKGFSWGKSREGRNYWGSLYTFLERAEPGDAFVWEPLPADDDRPETPALSVAYAEQAYRALLELGFSGPARRVLAKLPGVKLGRNTRLLLC